MTTMTAMPEDNDDEWGWQADDDLWDDDDAEPYEDDAWADSETLNSAGWGEWD
jgi:hypothetical protein